MQRGQAGSAGCMILGFWRTWRDWAGQCAGSPMAIRKTSANGSPLDHRPEEWLPLPHSRRKMYLASLLASARGLGAVIRPDGGRPALQNADSSPRSLAERLKLA